MRKVASITAIVVGIIMAIAAVATWVVVDNTLSDQKIVVAAMSQAKTMGRHTSTAPSGGTCTNDTSTKAPTKKSPAKKR